MTVKNLKLISKAKEEKVSGGMQTTTKTCVCKKCGATYTLILPTGGAMHHTNPNYCIGCLSKAGKKPFQQHPDELEQVDVSIV